MNGQHERKLSRERMSRPARTGVQAVPAVAVVEFVHQFFFAMDRPQYMAAVVLAQMLIGYLQVRVEDRAGKGFLREIE